MVKLVVGNRTVNVFSVYTDLSKSVEMKKNFWNLVFQIVREISLDEYLSVL